MADFRAIEGTTNAVVRLLQASYASEDFGHDLLFQAYVPESFQQPMTAGVSVFLYRIVLDGVHRMPPPRFDPSGARTHPQLPLDLHYLLTFWARDASLQHRIAGWTMRTIEDTPVLPHALLEAAAPGVFGLDETVQVIPAELSNEDLFRIWDVLGQSKYQLSVPYLARNVLVASRRPREESGPVQERRMDWAVVESIGVSEGA
jgi:hypothetical protein